ncbi:TPA: hypothetical protein ACTDMQ_002651 [Salmonella enterica subsp. enterica serovar Muenchen]
MKGLKLVDFKGSLAVAWLGLAWLGLAWLGLAWLGLAARKNKNGVIVQHFFPPDDNCREEKLTFADNAIQ